MIKKISNQEEKKPAYKLPKFGYVQLMSMKDGKDYMVGINREDSQVYFWSTRTGEWKLFKDLYLS